MFWFAIVNIFGGFFSNSRFEITRSIVYACFCHRYVLVAGNCVVEGQVLRGFSR